ncbi:unnamed protein product, partial [Closterium sp. NIES-53]
LKIKPCCSLVHIWPDHKMPNHAVGQEESQPHTTGSYHQLSRHCRLFHHIGAHYNGVHTPQLYGCNSGQEESQC